MDFCAQSIEITLSMIQVYLLHTGQQFCSNFISFKKVTGDFSLQEVYPYNLYKFAPWSKNNQPQIINSQKFSL